MKLSYYKLQQQLDKGTFDRIYVVVGQQELLRELAVAALQESVLGGETTPFNCERFDGEEADGADVAMSANTLPLLGGERVVIVKRAQKLLEKSEALKAYVASPSPGTTLVLDLSKSPDKRKKAWKEIEKVATVVVCDAPRPAELEEWVAEQAFERDLKLGRDGVRYLVSEFGTDLRRLLNELEKLSLYSAGERLELTTIASVLGRGKAQSIFKFVDAVGAGKAELALRQLGRLLDEGEPPLKILALVDRLVGQLRVANEIQSSGRQRGGSGLARVLGVPPYAAKSLSDAARRFDRAQLTRALRATSDSDRTLKSSALPARLVLESLTISLCAASGGVKPGRPQRAGG